MLKKTVTYEDFNGNQVTEDFYFHLSKAELMEMELSEEGGFANSLKKIVADADGKNIVETFKWIILQSYGEKSDDGRRFIKSDELRKEFEQHVAFSEMFIEFATDAKAAAEFIRGVVPAGLEQDDAAIEKQIAEMQVSQAVETTPAPALEAQQETELSIGDYSREDLLAMPQEEFQRLAGTDPKSMPREVLEVAMQRKSQKKEA